MFVLLVFHVLCHTMACFCVISSIQISIGYYPCMALPFVDISSVHTTICVPWLIIRTQWVMALLESPIVILQWVMMLLGTSFVMCTSQCKITLLWMSFVMYYYTYLWYCCFTTKLYNCTHKSLKSISNQ